MTYSDKRKINVIIPSAGAATRLRPLSSNISKTMVRVNGKPCIDYILESIQKNHEINKLVIVDGKYDDIREYVPQRWKFIDTGFVKQDNLDGPRNAILLGLRELNSGEEDGDYPVVIWLGDTILLDDDLNLTKNQLFVRNVIDHQNWCMWDGVEFYDKPEKTIENGVALVGIYSFENTSEAYEDFVYSSGYDISSALKLKERSAPFERTYAKNWYDIGDIANYYKTCGELLSLKSREFNSIRYNAELNTITKIADPSSTHAINSIKDEISWYTELDWKQRLFVPRFKNNSKFKEKSLTLSYESGTLLSDYLLYENLTNSTWEYILNKVFHTISKFFHKSYANHQFLKEDQKYKMWDEKTSKRLSEMGFTGKIFDILLEKAKNVRKNTSFVSGMHGDLHLGNILFNPQNEKLIFIDPRGSYGDYKGRVGDTLYDWGKLAHDVIWGYNHIVSDIEYTRQEEMEALFKKLCEKYNVSFDLSKDAGLVLLATCIPLHYDDEKRQQRMIDVVERAVE